jgi:transcriptional regulator with XRE-family HTH domain
LEIVSIKDDVREFLTSRRAKVTPEQADLPTFGDKRRVAGLRREEVALLAGVSADYYTRLERGNLAGVSEQVLDALARALRLDDAERSHLFDLARASTGPVRGSRRTAVSKVLHNSLVGDLDLTGEAMELLGDGLVIITYTAEPDTPAAEALRFLSSWATRYAGASGQHDNTPEKEVGSPPPG